MKTPFERRLADARHVLLAGCGGGFDVVSAIPLQRWLVDRGVRTTLANMSFAALEASGATRIGPAGWVIEPDCRPLAYFPERLVAEWLQMQGLAPRVYAYRPTGVVPMHETFEAILEVENIDAVVLVDGGTDSLMRGDEARLGTIEEDAISLVALSLVREMPKLLACLGFGIDHFHGVCHHSFLENTAEMIRTNNFLGCLSLVAGTPEGNAFIDLVAHLDTRQPAARSIVANSIASALRGEFGDYHATSRTAGATLFINALMSLYWCYDATQVAAAMRFSSALAGTSTFAQVGEVIAREHARQRLRPQVPLPL